MILSQLEMMDSVKKNTLRITCKDLENSNKLRKIKEDSDSLSGAFRTIIHSLILSLSFFLTLTSAIVAGRVGSIESANNLLRLLLRAHLCAYQRSLGAPYERSLLQVEPLGVNSRY